jgi:hypothetical protein
MSKENFFLRFKDEIVIIPFTELDQIEGTPVYRTESIKRYLEEKRPDKLPAYEQHLIDFEKKFRLIDSKIKY